MTAWIIPALCILWPNLLLFGVDSHEFGWLTNCVMVLIDLAGIAILFVLSANLRRLWLWCFPYALFAPVLAGYILEFRQPPYSGMWQTLFATTQGEALEQVKTHWTTIVAAIAALACYIWFGLNKAAARIRFHRTTRLGVSVCGAWMIIIGLGVPWFQGDGTIYYKTISSDAFYASYPVGTGMLGAITWKQRERATLIALPHITFTKPTGRRILVQVIGETDQFPRWREVALARHSPLLEHGEDTVVFSDNYSQANLTLNSVPMLLTGASTKADARERPIWPQYARAAGCRTIWLSNNEFVGHDHYDDRVDLLWTTWQLNPTANNLTFDDQLLPELERVLTQGGSNLCVVLHLIGSHAAYVGRYPAASALYPVDLSAYWNPLSSGYRAAQRAAYANAVAHSQRLVEQVIERLKKESDAAVFLVYAADHGENLWDDGTDAGTHGRAHPSSFELHVPMLFWANQRFRLARPAAWRNLQQLAALPTSNRSLFPTILDVLGIDASTDVPSLFVQDPAHLPEPLFLMGQFDARPISQLPAMATLSKDEQCPPT